MWDSGEQGGLSAAAADEGPDEVGDCTGGGDGEGDPDRGVGDGADGEVGERADAAEAGEGECAQPRAGW